jgi:predicted nucleotidyltransferase
LLDFSTRNDLAHLIEPLRRLTAAARELDTDMFVVGAIARDVAFRSWGMAPLRITSDLDVAVAVPDWSSYEAMRDRFRRTAGAAAHRVEVAGAMVDLVPFGGVENPAGQIAWPPDQVFVMTVVGFAEARRAAVTVRLAMDVEVDFASPAGLMVLKLVAWAERRWSRPRSDSLDLGELLRAQGEPWNFERIYETEVDALIACDDDAAQAGAMLLGRDVRGLFGPATLGQLLSIIDGQSTVESQLIREMDGFGDLNLELLTAFRRGLTRR